MKTRGKLIGKKHIFVKSIPQAFVYFSTAFSYIAKDHLDEKPVPSLASLEDIEYCLKTGDTKRLANIESKFLCSTKVFIRYYFIGQLQTFKLAFSGSKNL